MMAKLYNTRVRVPADFPAGEAISQCETNDVAASKPLGRVTTDGGSSRESKLLKCKKTNHIATLNAR